MPPFAITGAINAATTPQAQSFWGNLSSQFQGFTSKAFEAAGEGSAYWLKNKIDKELGLPNAAEQQAYLDATASAAYQRQQQTGIGRDWDGSTLNDEFITLGGVTVSTNTAKTGGLIVGVLLLSVVAFKLIK